MLFFQIPAVINMKLINPSLVLALLLLLSGDIEMNPGRLDKADGLFEKKFISLIRSAPR